MCIIVQGCLKEKIIKIYFLYSDEWLKAIQIPLLHLERLFLQKKKKKLRKFNGMWCNARCSAFLKLLHQSHVTYLGNACTLDLNIMDGILEQLEHSLNISWNKTVFSLINKVIWSSSL